MLNQKRVFVTLPSLLEGLALISLKSGNQYFLAIRNFTRLNHKYAGVMG